MKFTREQYIELMTFERWQRPMFVELFGPIVGLEAEWRKQGATEKEVDLVAFDWDYVPVVQCGANMGFFGNSHVEVLEDTDEYRIERDELGRTIKLCKGYSTLPLPLDFPVKCMDDWIKIKPFFTFHPDRVDLDAVKAAKREQESGALVVASIPGGFDTLRELMGEKEACMAYYVQPDLVVDIMNTLRDTVLQCLEIVNRYLVIDQLSAHEDMAGKNGPIIGPALIDEFIHPYYALVWKFVSGQGTRLFDIDSDGNIMPILDSLLNCGVNSLHPFEPAAGMDIVEIRKKYGKRIAIRGGLDKFALIKDHETIRRELEYKMSPEMINSGGIAFGLDHRIIGNTSIENYRYYVEYGRKLLGLPPLNARLEGWGRMAF